MSEGRAEYMRRLRRRWKEQGLCHTCGRARDLEGKAGCARCIERRRGYLDRNRHSEERLARNAAVVRERRARWKEQGLCPQCGGERDRDGVWCSRCRLMQRLKYVPRSEWGEEEREAARARERSGAKGEEYRKRRVEATTNRRERLKAEGKCQECAWAPVWEGHTRCRGCHEKALERQGYRPAKRRCKFCRDVLPDGSYQRACKPCQEAGMNRWKAQAMGDSMRALWDEWEDLGEDGDGI